jgi:hypothetical protein
MKTCASIFASLLISAVAAKAQVSFKKHTVHPVFISEGVATADVNKDGKTDILAGVYWFEAPSWKPHRIHADTLKPVPGYSTTFLNFCMDVNSDGWQDLIRFDQPGAICAWYENPQGKDVPWQSHTILENAGNETPILVDVDLDGEEDIICNDSGAKQVIWLKPPSGKGASQWTKTIISSHSERGTHKYTHGLGWGDMNKDGRNDVIIHTGWWESPADVTQPEWTFHPAALGKECANMFVLDADGDGDMDVVSSSAHNYGIWWHEQTAQGFTTHEISKQFSQTHAMAFEDINNDGHRDLITGKRYFAHNGKDPGAFEPAVLYWFEYRPGKTPSWIPHEIDNNSGVGNRFVVTDLNGDGLKDVITSNKKGVYYFEQVKNSR